MTQRTAHCGMGERASSPEPGPTASMVVAAPSEDWVTEHLHLEPSEADDWRVTVMSLVDARDVLLVAAWIRAHSATVYSFRAFNSTCAQAHLLWLLCTWSR